MTPEKLTEKESWPQKLIQQFLRAPSKNVIYMGRLQLCENLILIRTSTLLGHGLPLPDFTQTLRTYFLYIYIEPIWRSFTEKLKVKNEILLVSICV